MDTKGNFIVVTLLQLIAGIVLNAVPDNSPVETPSQIRFNSKYNSNTYLKDISFQEPFFSSSWEENEGVEYVPFSYDCNLSDCGLLSSNKAVFPTCSPYNFFASGLEKNKFLITISDLPPPLSGV